MASGISNYLADRQLARNYGTTAYTPPATIHIALFTARGTPAQTSANTGITEVAGGSYAREAVTNNVTNFPAPTGQVTSNATPIVFIQATADWGTVIGWAAYDAATVGNLLHWADLDTPRAVVNGDIVSFPVGEFEIAAGICL